MYNKNNAWYLVATKTRSEHVAQKNLQRQSYTIYLPLVKSKHRRNGRYIPRAEALFPGYLFIQLNREIDNWSPIRSTIGVIGLVRFGGMPAKVPAGLIESLETNEDESGYQKIDQQPRSGDRINIIDGPFAGQQGAFQAMKGSDRVLVLLNIMGKNTSATLSIDNLQIAV